MVKENVKVKKSARSPLERDLLEQQKRLNVLLDSVKANKSKLKDQKVI